MRPVFTIGHSTRTIPEFAAILGNAGVELVVDVRTVPRSRTNPQYNEQVLPAELEPFGIAALRIAELGGLRSRSHEVPPALNGWWQNRSFHNYADYALSDSFADGLAALVALADQRPTAIMCSEAVWWRCHRRIIADYLLLGGRQVFHLMGGGRIEPASLTAGAEPRDGKLTYPQSAKAERAQPETQS
jgi:uncharacterized protein (DUF488 family)